MRCTRLHHDAVNRAAFDTQLAAVAGGLDHGVQVALRADDGVDRTGGQTACTTDAGSGIDERYAGIRLGTAVRIQRQQWTIAADAPSAATPADPPGGQRLMAAVPSASACAYGTAAVIAAAPALRLR